MQSWIAEEYEGHKEGRRVGPEDPDGKERDYQKIKDAGFKAFHDFWKFARENVKPTND